MQQPLYRTIQMATSVSYTVQKSRFIGNIAPAQTKQEALAFVEQWRKKYFDASHHVVAYLLREQQVAKFTDDGEPQGTAGRPIMEVLQHHELMDVCLVVTRYFGGTLLGAGGLVRAYTKTASLAVQASDIKVFTWCEQWRLTLPYTAYGKVEALLHQPFVSVKQSDFGENITLQVAIIPEYTAYFHTQIAEVTGGSLDCTRLAAAYEVL